MQHYHFPPPSSALHSLPILRLSLHSTPYSHPTPIALAAQPPKIVYIAFPPATPHIYVSLPLSATANNPIASLLLSAIPKAFSRPRCRYRLDSTGFVTRNLGTLVSVRGKGRESGAQGGWGLYADGSVDASPLDAVPRGKRKRATVEVEDEESMDQGSGNSPSKRRRLELAQSRFGNAGREADGVPLERFAAVIEDSFTAEDSRVVEEGDGAEFRPNVRVLFHGKHIFAGIRKLVEEGVVDGAEMPAWMTGEAGVTGGKVRDGRMQAWDGF